MSTDAGAVVQRTEGRWVWSIRWLAGELGSKMSDREKSVRREIDVIRDLRQCGTVVAV